MSPKIKDQIVTIADCRKEIEELKARNEERFRPMIDFINSKLDSAPSKENTATITFSSKDQVKIVDLYFAAATESIENIEKTLKQMIANQDAHIRQSEKQLALVKATDPRKRIHLHEPKTDYKFH